MKTFAIYFIGHYPVGSVAVVRAKNKETAIKLFQMQLGLTEPILAEKNKDQRVLEIEQIFQDEPVHILLNGDY